MNKLLWAMTAIFTTLLGGCLSQAPATSEDNSAQLATKVELQLGSGQDTYILDLAQQQNQPIRTHQEVELTLALHNRSQEQVALLVGVQNWYTLKLEGPGAVEIGQQGPPGMWCIPSPNINVDAGQSHTESLRYIRYHQGRSFVWAWTKPGKYTVTAQAQVQIQGHKVLVHSNPVHFQVVLGEHPQPPKRPVKAVPAVPAGQAVSDLDRSWQKLFADEPWYQKAAGKEQVFRGKLEAIANAGGPSTLQRTAYYQLGERTIYTGAKKVKLLDQLVGQQVEMRGKPMYLHLEGQALKEIWPAAVRLKP